MDTIHPSAGATHPLLRTETLALMVVGLLGHAYAAHAIGGYRLAYIHHIGGFFIILAVTGAVIAGLGWRYWRTRRLQMWLVIALVQAALGLWIGSETLRHAAGA